ncbi:MAG: hypothetical protein AB8I08_11605 [Sandaracinaceae bacterium]
MRYTALLSSLLLVGCLPDLSFWEVERPDSGPPPPMRDGGGLPPRAMDCSDPIPIGAGYQQDFEAGAAGWGVTGGDFSWDLGIPRGEVINTAASGQRAWMTVIGGAYPNNEETYVVSPCFDASAAAQDLLFGMQVAASSESIDRMNLEVSVDEGVTWTVVEGDRRLGWHSSGSGWSRDLPWTSAQAIVAGTAGQATVQFRVKFRSDASVTGDGVAFDAVSVRASRLDLATSIELDSRCGYARVTVTNVGGAPVTGFEIRSTVDGVPQESILIDGVLELDEQEEQLIGGPLATQILGTGFEFGDENTANDTAMVTVESEVFPGAIGSLFESNSGPFEVGGENPSWQWGTPAAALINTASDGRTAWVTNLTGEYNNNERSYLQSPCYDMSAVSADPTVQFDRVFDTESVDRVGFEMSIDGGDFRVLGSVATGENWHGGSGWSGSSGAGVWQQSSHVMTGVAGHRYVRYRFFLRSDGSVTREGFGLDDFRVSP